MISNLSRLILSGMTVVFCAFCFCITKQDTPLALFVITLCVIWA